MPDRPPVMPDLGFGDDDLDDLDAAAEASAASPVDEPEEPALEHRPTPAERVLARIGHRAFARPRVAVSGRIFRRYRVTDPWDPDPDEPEDPIALGPVSLKLGDRRQPAPHLQPPRRKARARRGGGRDPGSFRPRVPQAGASSAPGSASTPPRSAPSAPRPTSRPAPGAAASATPEPSAVAREFGANSGRQPLRRPLPVRPDLPRPADATAAQSAAPAAGATSPSNPGRRAPGSAGGSAVPAAARPQPGRQAAGARTNRGRFRMASTQVSSPVIKEIRRLDEVTPEEARAGAAEEAPAPPPRPAMPMGDSLDDLFGMAAAGGRMSLNPRRSDPPPADDEDDDAGR